MICSRLQGDCRIILKGLPAESVHCCVTSPPYFGLRDYGVDGQIGLEPTPEAYVAELVAVFREVKRVLRDDGTLWLNLGDSYNSNSHWSGGGPGAVAGNTRSVTDSHRLGIVSGTKTKDLIGIPWMVAFALRADGWYLRQDIIWHKPNPMPESVTDRCTKAHEYVFLLSKSDRYYFDQDAIKEDCESEPQTRDRSSEGYGVALGDGRERFSKGARTYGLDGKRNRRSVWTVNTRPYKEAHFATFPPALIRPMILAGCPVGGTVLDPFGGSGTTGEVAESLGRNSILIELNPGYVELQQRRTAQQGLAL